MFTTLIEFYSCADKPEKRLWFLRIITAILALSYMYCIYEDLPYFYSSKAIVQNDLLLQQTNTLGAFFWIVNNWFYTTISQETPFIYVFFYTYVFCLLGMLIGSKQRIFSGASLVFHLMLIYANISFSYGFDYILSSCLFYSFIAKTKPLPPPYSPEKQASSETKITINTVVLRTLQIHLTILYLNTGISKALGYNWWNGESIWKVLHQPYHNNDFLINIDFLSSQIWLFTCIGILTVLLEILHPILVWKKRYQRASLFTIIALHIGIALLLNLYFFSALMIALNYCCWGNFDWRTAIMLNTRQFRQFLKIPNQKKVIKE